MKGSITSWVFGGSNCICAVGTAAGETPGAPIRETIMRLTQAGGLTPTFQPAKNYTLPELSERIKTRYEFLSVIGAGGMGTVYLVRDREIDKEFAMKIINPQFVTDPKAVRRFEQEAAAAKSMGTHPNLVAVYDSGVSLNSAPYILMEYVKGKDLSTVLSDEMRLYPEDVLRIFTQVAEALEFAHNKNVAHRDIKPSNIILSGEGEGCVKIVDFGIAKSLAPTEGANLTHSEEIIGSPLYMSPEQCKGEVVDARTDIYSLG
ncbi:MAG: serine/threonine protein kinase, partial [Terriglobales bacterium]